MSSQRGNSVKTGAPKHNNKIGFCNTMHDRSKKNLALVNMNIHGCCQRCKDIIDWKIKYKKYKPLSQPKTCTKCKEKNIKKAYFVYCKQCANTAHICAKCGEKKDTIQNTGEGDVDVDKYKLLMQKESKHLSERERRTYVRKMLRKLDVGGGDRCNEASSGDYSDQSDENEDEKLGRKEEVAVESDSNYHCEKACRIKVLCSDSDSD